MLNEDGEKAADTEADHQPEGVDASGNGPAQAAGEPVPDGDAVGAVAAESAGAEVATAATEVDPVSTPSAIPTPSAISTPPVPDPDIAPDAVLAPRSGLAIADRSLAGTSPADRSAASSPPKEPAAAQPMVLPFDWFRPQVDVRGSDAASVEAQPLEAPRPSGAASIGAFRPWDNGSSVAPKAAGPATRRRVRTAVGGALLILVLIVGALIFAIKSGPGGPTATPAQSNGGLAAASIQSTPAATPSPTASPNLSPSTSPSPGPTPAPGPVAATTLLTQDRGLVVSSDGFQNSHSGWATSKSNTASTSYQYVSGGYAIASRTGALEHFVYSPYRTGKKQLGMTVTASQTGAPSGAGFGVTCRRGTGKAQITYALVVLNTGKFYVERYKGVPSVSNGSTSLKRGTSSVTPGSTPITVVAMCATLYGGVTRLALFAEGQKLVDFTDSATLTGAGWAGGIDMVSGKTPSTLIARSWVERDLSK